MKIKKENKDDSLLKKGSITTEGRVKSIMKVYIVTIDYEYIDYGTTIEMAVVSDSPEKAIEIAMEGWEFRYTTMDYDDSNWDECFLSSDAARKEYYGKYLVAEEVDLNKEYIIAASSFCGE